MRAIHAGSIAAVALGLTLNACGGGSKTPTVAQLGSGPATTAASTSGGAGAGPTLQQAQAYAQCMRSHGVPNFPDPTAGPDGGFGFKFQSSGPGGGAGSFSSGGVNPQAPGFTTAQNACKSYLPNNGVPKQLTAAQQQAFLDWAACIRTHGVPDFPDPDFTGGGIRISLRGGPGSDTQTKLQTAQAACKSKLPAGFAGLGG